MSDSPLEPIARDICAQKGFEFIQSVGIGASKETFEVRGPNGSIALKVYKAECSPERNVREVRALQACDHPNIGHIIEFGDIAVKGNSSTYALEELLTGGTLTDRLKNGVLSRSQGATLGEAMIGAITHLADKQLVHRNIKPDNIMYRLPADEPVLIDFSIVRDLTDTSLTYSWMGRGPGTPIFASPEQLNNEKGMIDWRSDQFSLGLVLSIALLGLHPYAEPNTSNGNVVVERMANREARTDTFIAAAEAAGLGVLVKMTMPWPVERYRKPVALLADWTSHVSENG